MIKCISFFFKCSSTMFSLGIPIEIIEFHELNFSLKHAHTNFTALTASNLKKLSSDTQYHCIISLCRSGLCIVGCLI